jgi:hypothetical protein
MAFHKFELMPLTISLDMNLKTEVIKTSHFKILQELLKQIVTLDYKLNFLFLLKNYHA